MPIKHSWSCLWVAAFFAAVGLNLAQAAPLMIVGNDEKLLWDDNGKPIISPAGKDSVLIVDLADKGVWYRVQAGPLDEKQAQGICGTLKTRKADCVIVPPAKQ